MIGAGTIISPIIKVVTTVAILAAIYFFFVKPTLDTTENIANQGFDLAEEQIPNFDNIVPDTQQGKVNKALKEAEKQFGTSSGQVDKLINCVTNAAGDVEKLNACNAKFGP